MLSPPHPVAQCLARAADLLGNRVDRRPLGSVLGLVVQDHPNRASTDLRGIWGNSLRHGSILSRVGASGKPGTVQLADCVALRGQQALVPEDEVAWPAREGVEEVEVPSSALNPTMGYQQELASLVVP